MSRIQVFGPYELLERVGVGSMGEVFRAVERDGGRVVALKRLMPFVGADPDVVEALQGEANLALALDHPSVAKVYAVGDVGGTHYIAYEYVDGRDLRAIRDRAQARGTPIPLEVGIHVVQRIALALDHAHGRRDGAGKLLGLVHRDVCPSNILVAFDGSVKLSDFGIARAEGRVSRTEAGQVKGTLGYMSPEQVKGGAVDGRSDIYALGVCLWELATGTRLHDGIPALVVMERIASSEVPSPRSVAPDLSESLERVIAKSLAHSPEQRYPTAADLHDDLTEVARELGRLAPSTRVAQYVRSLFPESAAQAAPIDGGRGSASAQESPIMADSKGGSDLDVFEGLAKKSQRPAPPGLTPPPPSAAARQRTLVGGLVGGVVSPGPNSGNNPLPPPSMPRPSHAPLPPPTSGRLSVTTPAPSGRTGSGSLPAVSSPPPRTSAPPGTLPPASLGNLPPPTITPMRPSAPGAPSGSSAAVLPPPSGAMAGSPSGASAALPPPSMPRPSTQTPLPPPVPTLRPGDAVPPPPANKSLASALGVGVGAGATADDAAAAEAKAAKSVDMDWDDEEESTHVYDKGKHGDVASKMRPAAGTPIAHVGNSPSMAPKASAAAAALLMSSSTAASARTVSLPPPVSVPVPPVAPPSAAPPSLPSSPPSSVELTRPKGARDEPTSVRARPAPPQASGGKAGVVLGGLALAAVIGLGAFLLIPRTGVLKIDVKGKGGTGVARAEVFVDGQKRCDTAPCVVSDLSTGPKVIKVLAPDAAPVDVTETVEAGREKFVSVTVDTGAGAGMVGAASGAASGSPTAATATGGTGFKATGNQPGVKVLVDGTDKGALPLELAALTPGSHKVRFEGDRYEAKDETVEVVANQVKEVPVKLKVLKGSLTLELATAGASVTLASLTGKKEKKQLDSVLKVNKPVKLSDIDATQTWQLIASKKGMPQFTQDVSFEDGMPERSIRIELGGEVDKPAPVAATPGPGPGPGPGPKPGPGPGPATPPVTPPKETPAASGSGTLNINSIPVSKVVLDGKPLGSTPKVGVSVPAGNHTVTFIHPELGKKSVTVAVKAGETKTAVVKFDKPAE